MHGLGLESIEIGAGGYLPKNHCNPAELLANQSALRKFQETLSEFELTISAFAIHGEPLHPDPTIACAYNREFQDACTLAERIGVRRLTLLAGLPEAVSGDKAPNWIVFPYPLRNRDMCEWQWEQRLIPYWKERGKIAEDHGISLCFEIHPGDMVFNPEAFFRLRDAIGPVARCNLDPSHLFWQGMDIIEVVRTLGEMIFHVHAKDSQLDDHNVRVNGILDVKALENKQERSWIFRTVGYGHSEGFWRRFVSTLRVAGYDDVLSIEQDDPLLDSEEGFELAVGFLKGVLIRKPPSKLWYE
jgi:sugar phosphate isomerase/epimerase